MPTEDIVILIFYSVDNAMGPAPKAKNTKLYPREVIIIGILFALKGGRFRAFYRWLKRDYDGLFGGLPERTALQRQLHKYQYHADCVLAEPSLLNVIDSFFPIELPFPSRQGVEPGNLTLRTNTKDAGPSASSCVGLSTASERWWVGIGCQ